MFELAFRGDPSRYMQSQYRCPRTLKSSISKCCMVMKNGSRRLTFDILTDRDCTDGGCGELTKEATRLLTLVSSSSSSIMWPGCTHVTESIKSPYSPSRPLSAYSRRTGKLGIVSLSFPAPLENETARETLTLREMPTDNTCRPLSSATMPQPKSAPSVLVASAYSLKALSTSYSVIRPQHLNI